MRIFGMVLLIFVLLSGCSQKTEVKEKKPWDKIVKEMEETIALEEPDSVKYQRIQKIFEDNQITIEDYRNFYQEYVEQDPLKNLALIEKIESLLTQDYNQTAREERKQMENQPLQITAPKKSDRDNLELNKKPGSK
ncbi:MAG: hypothetical protein ACK2TU_07285 [Anaerolineales bacterium]